MLHGRPAVRGRVKSKDYGGGKIIQVKTAGAGKVTVLWDGTDSWVHGGAPPDQAWPGAGPSAGRHPANTRYQKYVLGILTKDRGVTGIPMRGLQGGDDK